MIKTLESVHSNFIFDLLVDRYSYQDLAALIHSGNITSNMLVGHCSSKFKPQTFSYDNMAITELKPHLLLCFKVAEELKLATSQIKHCTVKHRSEQQLSDSASKYMHWRILNTLCMQICS